VARAWSAWLEVHDGEQRAGAVMQRCDYCAHVITHVIRRTELQEPVLNAVARPTHATAAKSTHATAAKSTHATAAKSTHVTELAKLRAQIAALKHSRSSSVQLCLNRMTRLKLAENYLERSAT
jgi:hypothetical protein